MRYLPVSLSICLYLSPPSLSLSMCVCTQRFTVFTAQLLLLDINADCKQEFNFLRDQQLTAIIQQTDVHSPGCILDIPLHFTKNMTRGLHEEQYTTCVKADENKETLCKKLCCKEFQILDTERITEAI